MKPLDFMIVGAQKSGTTALSEFLAQHPGIEMAQGKEAHVFDDPKFNDSWTTEEINNRYKDFFTVQCDGIRGEATPIYMYMPKIARRLHTYNPKLKLIVLLRDPVERAYSHYRMERSRGNESFSYWFALFIEPIRLFRDRNKLSEDSSIRRHSYRDRGFYSRQLRCLYNEFPESQVLILRTEELRRRHQDTLGRVFSFLDVEPYQVQGREVFSQRSSLEEVPISSFFLRRGYEKELNHLEELLSFSVERWRH